MILRNFKTLTFPSFSVINKYKTNEQKIHRPWSSNGLRLASHGPLDPAGGVVKLRADPDPESDVSSTPPSIQIAVDFYLDTDIKKAGYFQKKLNSLVVKSLNAHSVERPQPPKELLSRKIKS